MRGSPFLVSCARIRRRVSCRRDRLELQTEAQRVDELPVAERVVDLVGVVEEELVLGRGEDERRGVHEVLHARLGGQFPGVGDAVAVDVADVGTDERLPAAEVEVVVEGDVGGAVPRRALGGADRYRVNLMFHKNGAAGAYRMVPAQVKTLAELGYEQHLETIKKMLSYHNGLILVTGPVGSGKTTTLASMVDYLNQTREDHIITVEDPIEVVQPAKGCNVTQREVGPHTRTFASALKGALREDPDVIVIGELRDLETIEMAISASETGHLVIGTMHTSDAATTLNRLLDVFSPAQQAQIRASVAESLRGIVCQRLLPGNSGGLVLACEILVSNTAIQNLIRENKSSGLRNTMETGVKEGMCLMDNVVFGLWQERKLSAETALANITNRVLRQKIPASA